MSCVDLMDELESMAQFVADHNAGPEVDDITIQKWQSLFGYSYSEAAKKLELHRNDVCQYPVSDAHWDLVSAEKQAQGYDKEAYEHACQLFISQQTRQEAYAPPAKTPSHFLVKMEGPFQTIEAITATGCLLHSNYMVPKLMAGTDDSGLPANFCIIDATAKHNLEAWLNSTKSTFQPTFIRYSNARKALSSTSYFPRVGIDTTLPQYRLSSDLVTPLPGQEEYPVWYFFYGTLADPAVLGRLFALDSNARLEYRPAKITGGALTMWGGKYMALVDAPQVSIVEGSAFLVVTKEQEDALRWYETDKYEVVRCDISMLDDMTVVRGLTFRFISP